MRPHFTIPLLDLIIVMSLAFILGVTLTLCTTLSIYLRRISKRLKKGDK